MFWAVYNLYHANNIFFLSQEGDQATQYITGPVGKLIKTLPDKNGLCVAFPPFVMTNNCLNTWTRFEYIFFI